MTPATPQQPTLLNSATRLFAAAILGVAGLLQLLSYFARHWWLADLAANLRIQWMLATLTGTLLFVFARQPRGILLGGLVAICSLPPIWSGLSSSPQSISPRSAKAASDTLTIACFNVLSDNRQLDAVLDQIRASRADVVALLEFTPALQRRMREELLAEYPWFLEHPSEGNFGIALYSRSALSESRLFRMAAPQLPSIEATIEFQGQQVRLYATHPLPPIPVAGFADRNQHLTELAEHIRHYRQLHDSHAVLVMGDLNVTPWSPLFQDFRQQTGLHRSDGGLEPTWYARPLFPCGLVLDHILHDDRLACTACDVGGAAGSDHRLIRSEFRSCPAADE